MYICNAVKEQEMSEAGVYTARGISELHQQVSTLAAEGFRIIAVFEANGDYHVVAQKELTEAERRKADIEAWVNS